MMTYRPFRRCGHRAARQGHQGRPLIATRSRSQSPSLDGMGGSMQLPNALAVCEQRLVCLWESLVTTLGIHTARVLLHRAVCQTAQRHPNIALIRHDAAVLSFEALETSYATRS